MARTFTVVGFDFWAGKPISSEGTYYFKTMEDALVKSKEIANQWSDDNLAMKWEESGDTFINGKNVVYWQVCDADSDYGAMILEGKFGEMTA